MKRVVMFVMLSVVLVSAAAAELTPGQKMAAETLIKDFGAKEFAARQAAVEKLIALGPDVVPLIRKTLAETPDNEVKLRCQMVLKGVADKFGAAAVAGTPPARTGTKTATTLDASKVTIDVKDTPVDEVLQRLSDGTGNALVRLTGELQEKTVTLNLKDVSYWQALDKLCAVTGSIYQIDYQTGKGGLVLIAVPKPADVGASSGPVSVKVNSITKMRTLRPFGVGQQPLGSLQCQIVFFWEDRLPVVSAEGAVTKATLPDGRVLVQSAQPMGAMPFRGMRMGGGQKTSSGNIFYQPQWTDAPEGIDKLSSLEGVVRLTAAVGPDKQLKVDDVLGEGEKTAEADGLTLLVTQDAKNANPANPDAVVPVQLSIKATRDGKPAAVPIEQLGEKYGVFLIDPAGNRHTPQGFSSGGGMRWGGIGNGPGVIKLQAGVAGQVIVAGGQGNDAQAVTLTFFNLPKIDGKWSLLVVWPGNTETKEYPFKIDNVPMP